MEILGFNNQIMPASRLLRKVTIEGSELVNLASQKAGGIRNLAQALGYRYDSLLSIRNSGLVSRKLEKILREYLQKEAA